MIHGNHAIKSGPTSAGTISTTCSADSERTFSAPSSAPVRTWPDRAIPGRTFSWVMTRSRTHRDTMLPGDISVPCSMPALLCRMTGRSRGSLTLNIGVPIRLYTQPVDAHGPRRNVQLSAAGFVLPGKDGLQSRDRRRRPQELRPRVGFAYSGAETSVVRRAMGSSTDCETRTTKPLSSRRTSPMYLRWLRRPSRPVERSRRLSL